MARIDLKRRGEIGRERRAKTRAQLIEAARLLFTSRPFASVTVEEVTRQARALEGRLLFSLRAPRRPLGRRRRGASGSVRRRRRREPALRRRPRRANRRGLHGLHRRSSARSRLGSAHRPWRLGLSECRLRSPRALEDKPAACAKRGAGGVFFDRGRLRSRLRHRHPRHALGERGAAFAP